MEEVKNIPGFVQRHERLATVLPFALVGLVLIVLAAIPWPVDIRAEIFTSGLTFVPGGSLPSGLLSEIPAEYIELQGLHELRYFVGRLEAAGAPVSGLLPRSRETDGGVVAMPSYVHIPNAVLNRLRVSAGGRVWLLRKPGSGVLNVTLEGDHSGGEIGVEPRSGLLCEGCSKAAGQEKLTIMAERDQILEFDGGTAPLTIGVLPKTAHISGEDYIPISGDIRFVQPAGSAPGFKSALLDGSKISVPETGGEYTIGKNESLSITSYENLLRIDSIEMDRGIHLRISGRAAKAMFGSNQGGEHAVLPSLLGWLHTKFLWKAVAGDVIAIGTMILAVLSRLKILRQEKAK